jgi:hypothetical protein
VREQQRRYWSKLIAEQEGSGQKARPFCRKRGISQWSFYKWRRRLRQADPVEFAVLGTVPTVAATSDFTLELMLRNGERLRISSGVDAVTLRLVLDAVRS